MGFGIDRRARSRRPRGGLRAWFGAAPGAREVGDRLVRLARRTFRGAVLDATSRRVTLALHPAARPVRLVVDADATIELRADTTALGPGYHAEVLARLRPLLDELDYALDGDDGDPQAGMTAWLAGELRDGARLIGMPADRCFLVDAPVLTAMGPRDAAWRDAVLADPRRGADAFAWWERGPGREARARALLAMWLDVAWREPLDDDERARLEQVDADLTAARRADRELALPWPDWAALLDALGADDDHAARVRKKAAGRAATIGYRRYAMDLELSGGWIVELGGAFAGRWEDDHTRWWATDGARVVEFTSLTARDETDSRRLLDVAAPVHPVVERFEDATRCGRAEAHDEGDLHIVTGLMTCAPNVGILTCKGRPSDQPWALATWRSLRNV